MSHTTGVLQTIPWTYRSSDQQNPEKDWDQKLYDIYFPILP